MDEQTKDVLGRLYGELRQAENILISARIGKEIEPEQLRIADQCVSRSINEIARLLRY